MTDAEPRRRNAVTASVRDRAGDVLCFGLTLYALYWVIGIVDPQIYRVSFLLIALAATFLVYPFSAGGRSAWARNAVDGLCIALAVAALAWPIVDFDAFVLRAATPTTLDLVLGAIAIAAGPRGDTTNDRLDSAGDRGRCSSSTRTSERCSTRLGLSLIAHRGYSVPTDRRHALHDARGHLRRAARRHRDLHRAVHDLRRGARAQRRRPLLRRLGDGRDRPVGQRRGPGRTVTVAGYLLGAVSGSGVANTVMLGAVAWPMMRRAGYPPDTGGAILAAAGIGAILAPPVMGAAAFLIAEFLNITYLQVHRDGGHPGASSTTCRSS